jgi:pyridoxal phosphate enzyme (YggS family)
MSIAENVERVQERIAQAARRAGRKPEEVTLVAVSKTFPAESIREAYAAGLRVFGENRVQEFADKSSSVRHLPGSEWHLIGHLQSNKAGKAVELFDCIDSLDSVRLAEKLNGAADKLNKTIPVLIEVNIGGEEAKSGVAARSAELEQLLTASGRLRHLQIRGLMTVPPFTDDPESARPYFRQLRQLRDQIATRKLPGISMDLLSMGMSHDFEIAIEEGSDCVRVGTAIFGKRETLSPPSSLSTQRR